jgi:hypothetical protein
MRQGIKVAIGSLFTFLLLIEGGSLTICSLIVKDKPIFYTQYWDTTSSMKLENNYWLLKK